MAGTGGKREGAGRKVGSPNKTTQEIRDILAESVDFVEVVDKVMQLVRGVTVQQQTADGPIVYERPPDVNAAKLLMEYAFGKPKQQMDVKVDTNPIKTIALDWANAKENP